MKHCYECVTGTRCSNQGFSHFHDPVRLTGTLQRAVPMDQWMDVCKDKQFRVLFEFVRFGVLMS